MAVLLLVLMSLLSSGSSAPAQANCVQTLLSMMPCLDYITDHEPSPPSGCCINLSNVLGSQPLCLCHILNGDVAKLLGIQIDQNRALALPGFCNLQTPPISECQSGFNKAAAEAMGILKLSKWKSN
ncbi:non-specific lipid transfer protein GPI-anchored 5-like [Typha angustifolia]|uniref:non-specific lipid transfer protein GPI-anchored 5-like n=1 Tax=Typha angustifolia TaxID=59011 RepID=UPI003C30723C